MKVLVVDDQPDVVEGILDGVNWEKLKIEKAYGSNNAAQARSVLEREKIDILLCDIEMPGEDGLSLVSWVQEKDRSIKCIFLTAHADFSYAQKALQLAAADYLLQPASYESIEEAILRAEEQLQVERLSHVYAAMGKNVEREAPSFYKHLLRDYVLGIRTDGEEIAKKSGSFGFLASEVVYRCVLIGLQTQETQVMEATLLGYGIQNVLEELFSPGVSQVTVIPMEEGILLALLAFEKSEGKDGYKALYRGMKTFYRFSQRKLELECSLYFGRQPITFPLLPEEYVRLKELHKNNVTRQGGVILPKRGESTIKNKPDYAKWDNLLRQGFGSTVREEIHAYLEEMGNKGGLNREALFQFHEGFMQSFFGVIQQYNNKVQDIFNETFDYNEMLQAYTSLPQLLKFVDFATEYVESKQKKETDDSRSQIERVLDFIQKNLVHDIGRSEIAKAVYLNPEYLSRLFKKEMGMGLNEYLVQERMKLAKSLLQSTSFPVSIVASKVGYTNFSHFAKVFKSIAGVSPSEYRKISKKE